MDFRHEYKFHIDEKDIVLCRAKISPIMSLDAHSGQDGFYHIRSVYFDDYADTCYYQNEAGTDPRAKYRIRIYGDEDGIIRLEKKIKKNGMTRKESCKLTKEQALAFLGDLRESQPKEEPPVLQEFRMLFKTRMFRPKVIVDYDRCAYVQKEGNVRVTFDKNIASSTAFQSFFDRNLPKRPILPAGQHLLEVKYDEFLPQTVKENLSGGRLRQTTFSKYYLCRKALKQSVRV